ncbi:hypothetical protein GF391_04490 [Candidatus Uhrbacteria bacterium]|nr:hypothetical protein [Candidatus Uhrbacteria bacterium]
MKKRTFAICIVTLCLTIPASAFAQGVTDPSDLGQCIAECEAQLKLICFDESHRDITKLCPQVKACTALSQDDQSAATALLGACYEGVTNNCPSMCPPGGPPKAKTPKRKTPPTTKRPPTKRPPSPKRDKCEAAGGFYLTEPGGSEKFCYTHQSMYEHLRGVEARLNALEDRAKTYIDSGEPVPSDLKRDYESERQLLMDIDRSVVGLSDELKAVTDRMIELANHFNQRIARLESRMDANEAMASAALGEAKAARREKAGAIEPALVGWRLNPYFTAQAFTLYDQTMFAGGLEAGIYPSLSASGRHRLALNLGVGKAGDYFEQSMVQHHVSAGYAYFAPAGSLSLGLGVNRYSLTDVQQGRLFWAGPVLEGTLNLADLSKADDPIKGQNLFVSGRLGLGWRWGRHGILGTGTEPVKDRFDAPVTFGIGVQGVPFLGD